MPSRCSVTATSAQLPHSLSNDSSAGKVAPQPLHVFVSASTEGDTTLSSLGRVKVTSTMTLPPRNPSATAW